MEAVLRRKLLGSSNKISCGSRVQQRNTPNTRRVTFQIHPVTARSSTIKIPEKDNKKKSLGVFKRKKNRSMEIKRQVARSLETIREEESGEVTLLEIR